MPEAVEQVIDNIFYCVAAASGIAWIWLAKTRIAKRLPIIEPQARTRPFWTLAEFFVCFGLLLVCTIAGLKVGTGWMSPETAEQFKSGTLEVAKLSAQDSIVITIIDACAKLLGMTSVLVWMNLITPYQLNRYGLIPSLDDLKLGVKAAFFVLPSVLLISLVVNTFVKYEHPVLDTLASKPTLEMMWILAFTTVLLAPIFEEFAFRVLLQGGAEQLTRKMRLMIGAGTEPMALNMDVITATEVASWSWWPVVMSSSTFAALHLGQGGGAVPIFFLALALGYLYRQTGRIGPGLVVHVILNGFTIFIGALKFYFDA